MSSFRHFCNKAGVEDTSRVVDTSVGTRTMAERAENQARPTSTKTSQLVPFAGMTLRAEIIAIKRSGKATA